MQQTICGVIPNKIKVLDRKVVDNFLDESEELFTRLRDSQYCLYDNSKIVSDHALNYLNTFSSDESKEQLKILIKKEFIECEKIYPYLGDLFISRFFAKENKVKCKKYLFLKDSVEEYSDSLKFKELRSIFNWIVEKSSLEYTVNLQSSVLSDIFVEKNNILNFDLDYDSSFLGGKDFHTMNNYKFIIIDGFIESIGEIHHLLDQANRTKSPYVIFCFGMSEEVSHVIKHNNSNNKFEVMPVIITFDENTINVLNDIAVLHKEHVVSSRSGETISQAVRRDLPEGKQIVFYNKGFKIKPVASDTDLMIHRVFLGNKLDEVTTHTVSKKLLARRIKRFSSKLIKIYIPENLYANNDFIRELDYMLRFIKHSNRTFSITTLNKNKYYLPEKLIALVDKKVKSLKNIYSKIERLIIHEGR